MPLSTFAQYTYGIYCLKAFFPDLDYAVQGVFAAHKGVACITLCSIIYYHAIMIFSEYRHTIYC